MRAEQWFGAGRTTREDKRECNKRKKRAVEGMDANAEGLESVQGKTSPDGA